MESGRTTHADDRATQSARILAHLDGALDEQTLDAMQGVWAMLEHAAADAPAHARAVRARLFWESLTPGGVAAAPTEIVRDLAPSWDEEEAEAEFVTELESEFEPEFVSEPEEAIELGAVVGLEASFEPEADSELEFRPEAGADLDEPLAEQDELAA